MKPLVLLSVNNSWNVLNFRAGLIRRLQVAGFAVSVLSPSDAHAGQLAALGVTHIPIAMNSTGLSPIGDFALLLRYIWILRRYRPAAFLAWTVKPNVYGSIAAHIFRIPVINNVSGLGTAFIRQGMLTKIVSALYRLALSRSVMVFFQNPDDRRSFVSSRIVAEKRTALLPGSGIDTKRFAPVPPSAHRHLSTRPFTFLLIARLLRDKGVVEYVEAARRILATRSDARFELLGFVDVANRTAISRAQLTGWINEGLVTYLGEATDVRPYIADADCIVLPSYREGMPRALLEGAALAKPLIATRVPGCIEIARDGQNALLCKPRDAGSLADAMLQMMDLSADQRTRMGAAGRHIAVTEFDEAVVADRYLAALSTAMRTDS